MLEYPGDSDGCEGDAGKDPVKVIGGMTEGELADKLPPLVDRLVLLEEPVLPVLGIPPELLRLGGLAYDKYLNGAVKVATTESPAPVSATQG